MGPIEARLLRSMRGHEPLLTSRKDLSLQQSPYCSVIVTLVDDDDQ